MFSGKTVNLDLTGEAAPRSEVQRSEGCMGVNQANVNWVSNVCMGLPCWGLAI